MNWPTDKKGSSKEVVYMGQTLSSILSIETMIKSDGISEPCRIFPALVIPIPTIFLFTSN